MQQIHTGAFEAFPVLETPRLILRQLNRNDLALVYAMRRDPSVGKFIGRQTMKNKEEAESLIQKTLAGYEKKESLAFVAIHKATSEAIGTCGLFNINANVGKAEIGGEMDKTYWGKKLALEATSEIVRFGFNQMNLHRMEAYVSPQNLPAVNLLQKLDFVREGHFKDYFILNDSYSDLDLYAQINPHH